MKLTSLATLAIAAALFSAAATVGCSEPNVSGFQGTNAQPAADDDDDDSSKSSSTQKPGTDSKNSKTEKSSTSTASTAPTDTGGTKPASPPAPAKPTPQECFTHCVRPVPEAVALDACTLECADNDTDCLGDCYTSSNCGANPLCDQAIAQCGDKCPQTN